MSFVGAASYDCQCLRTCVTYLVSERAVIRHGFNTDNSRLTRISHKRDDAWSEENEGKDERFPAPVRDGTLKQLKADRKQWKE